MQRCSNCRFNEARMKNGLCSVCFSAGAEPDPTAALHARIATLTAERDEYKANADAAEDVVTAQRDRAKLAERQLAESDRLLIVAERERDTMADLLAEAGARLSLHYANPIDASVCDRILAIDAARRTTTSDACGTCGSPTCEGTHMKTDHEGHGKLCPYPSLPCCCRIAPAPKVTDE